MLCISVTEMSNLYVYAGALGLNLRTCMLFANLSHVARLCGLGVRSAVVPPSRRSLPLTAVPLRAHWHPASIRKLLGVEAGRMPALPGRVSERSSSFETGSVHWCYSRRGTICGAFAWQAFALNFTLVFA